MQERERERERDMEIFLLNLDRALLLVPASLSFRGEGASPRLVDVNERAFLKSDDGDRSSYKLLLHHQALADTSQGPRFARVGLVANRMTVYVLGTVHTYYCS
jgi:hypothetical protein